MMYHSKIISYRSRSLTYCGHWQSILTASTNTQNHHTVDWAMLIWMDFGIGVRSRVAQMLTEWGIESRYRGRKWNEPVNVGTSRGTISPAMNGLPQILLRSQASTRPWRLA